MKEASKVFFYQGRCSYTAEKFRLIGKFFALLPCQPVLVRRARLLLSRKRQRMANSDWRLVRIALK
ncbi:hypothetical protein Q2T83_17580 [Fervidibacter sacchari]|nr:hypothetical protein [Candidatus Fervidibacter sacchari]WKU16127.1 hypothetical protein Q2T83_17580 [Candidatus Fervidibacter sacchari]